MGKGGMRSTLCNAPIHDTSPDHNIGNSVPYSLMGVCRVTLKIIKFTTEESIELVVNWVLSKLTG